jgi:hypothetical protein
MKDVMKPSDLIKSPLKKLVLTATLAAAVSLSTGVLAHGGYSNAVFNEPSTFDVMASHDSGVSEITVHNDEYQENPVTHRPRERVRPGPLPGSDSPTLLNKLSGCAT